LVFGTEPAEEKMNHTESTPRFKTSPDRGLRVRDRQGKWRRICDYVEVAGEAREEQVGSTLNSTKVLVVINFNDSRGHQQQIIMPRRSQRRPSLILDELMDKGFNVPSTSRDETLLCRYLRTATGTGQYTVVCRTGWINRRCYLRADGEFLGQPPPHSIYRPADSSSLSPKSNGGSLKGWIEQVATPARHSKLLMVFISVSFGTLLLKSLKLESFLLHIFSKRSSVGKTLAELAAHSVHCKAERNLLHHWDFTKASREELAAEHCDRILVFDETGHLIGDSKHAAATVQETAFQISANRGRLRSAVWAKDHKTCTWRTIVISSGEKAIVQIVDEANRQRLQGDQVRLLDIPACSDGARYGVFDSLPKGITSSKRLARRIERACARHFGYPAREFVTHLVATRGLTKRCRQWMRSFYLKATVPEKPWERRFAERFALTYAAGQLAIEWNIVPWNQQELLDAVVTTYGSARSVVRLAEDKEKSTDEIVAEIRVRLSDRSRFRDLRSTARHKGGPTVEDADGFIKRDRNGVYFVVKRAALKRWFGKNVNLASLGKRLLDSGYLITERRRSRVPTKEVQIPGIAGRRRYYCISRQLVLDGRRSSPAPASAKASSN
jgi:putative DNA primase/helicase